MNTTEKFGFLKPAQDDYYNVDDFNTNMDKVEAAILSLDLFEPFVAVISDDLSTITTTNEDGSKMVAVIDDTSITTTEYDTEENVKAKHGYYMSDNSIEGKELAI